jgi:hypothetical protein
LAAFLGPDQVVSIDIALSAWHEPAPSLVLADGARLPFEDQAFDVVVSLDTIEDVIPAKRFATVTTLQEHLAFGHPEVAEVEETLGAQGPRGGVFPERPAGSLAADDDVVLPLMRLGRDDPVERVQAWHNQLFTTTTCASRPTGRRFCAGTRPRRALASGGRRRFAARLPSETPDASGFAALKAGLGQEQTLLADDYHSQARRLEASRPRRAARRRGWRSTPPALSGSAGPPLSTRHSRPGAR